MSISWIFNSIVGAWILPPGLLFVLLLAGLFLLRRRPRAGRSCLIAATALLYLLSTPLFSRMLLQNLETPAASPDTFTAAKAIVVLGGGKYRDAPEYGMDTVSAATLVRLRYAAVLHRRTGLPLLVSGGSPDGSPVSEARAMRDTLEQEFGVPVRWIEDRSVNTLENARLSHALLRPEGIVDILLVTQARHMPRSQLVFERAGFRVVPAPIGHTTQRGPLILDLLPTPDGLAGTAWAMREMVGMVWYRLRLLAQA